MFHSFFCQPLLLLLFHPSRRSAFPRTPSSSVCMGNEIIMLLSAVLHTLIAIMRPHLEGKSATFSQLFFFFFAANVPPRELSQATKGAFLFVCGKLLLRTRENAGKNCSIENCSAGKMFDLIKHCWNNEATAPCGSFRQRLQNEKLPIYRSTNFRRGSFARNFESVHRKREPPN